METVTTIREARAALDEARRAGRSIGFVPTMGYLHAGHVSLIERAAADTEVVVVSLFVNPLQFGPTEDLAAYPRDPDGDADKAAAAGAALLFVPSVGEMYPRPMATTVVVAGVSEGLEGGSRPTHFSGVATVVTKLFNIVGPCRAYFGEKDYQQLAVIRRLVEDLDQPVDVVGCPTVREPDGLALSSRNAYLAPEERAVAGVLHRALRAGAELVEAGERDPAAIEARIGDVLAGEPLVRPDYVAAVAAGSLERPACLDGDVRLLVAARLGKARLIDNIGARVGGTLVEGERSHDS